MKSVPTGAPDFLGDSGVRTHPDFQGFSSFLHLSFTFPSSFNQRRCLPGALLCNTNFLPLRVFSLCPSPIIAGPLYLPSEAQTHCYCPALTNTPVVTLVPLTLSRFSTRPTSSSRNTKVSNDHLCRYCRPSLSQLFFFLWSFPICFLSILSSIAVHIRTVSGHRIGD